MSEVQQLAEDAALCHLSLDPRVRALAESLLTKLRSMVGDLRASDEHHHLEADGLYRHSLDMGLHALIGKPEVIRGDASIVEKLNDWVSLVRQTQGRRSPSPITAST